MIVKRGEVWMADLNPVRGSEQAGMRPVLIVQTNAINRFTTTVLAIPFTTNLRRAGLPSCVQVASDEGGLSSDSVALCHQLRVLNKTRITRRMGKLSVPTLEKIENRVLFTLGIRI